MKAQTFLKGFINIYSVTKYQKTRKGNSFETLKNFRKKSHNAKKIGRGDNLVSSGFVGYVEKVKNERGDPFALISADRTCLCVSSFSSFVCKKSGPIRVRLLSAEKKTSQCSSRALFTRKAPTKKMRLCFFLFQYVLFALFAYFE